MADAPLHLIRAAVRAEHAYRVPTESDAPAKLDQNESPFDLPDEIKRAALEAFARTPWNRYPDDRPHRLAARLAAAAGLPREAVMVGRGSNELTHTLGLAFLAPGTPVVLPSPMFALYASVARMHEARIVDVPAGERFAHDADAILEAARAAGAPLTVVTTPNNPTGQTIPYEDLQRLAAGVPGFLLIDEAYHEFLTGPTALDLLAEHSNVLVMRTFSKAMGLAGLRLGYLAGHPDVVQTLERARLPFLVDRLSEEVALAVLDRPDLLADRVATLLAERERLLDRCAALGVETIPSAANFFLARTPLPVPELRSRLAAEGVLIRDVTGYPALAPREGRSGWVRISVGTPDENRRLEAALEAALAPATA